MEHMQGRQEDQTRGVEGTGEKDVADAPATGAAAAAGPEVESGGLGGVGTEGVRSGRTDWPADEPGTSGGQDRDEPSGRVGP